MSSIIFIYVCYFVLCLYSVSCSEYIPFWITFCCDDLNMWDCCGRRYESCIFVLFGGEVCLQNVSVVFVLVFGVVVY